MTKIFSLVASAALLTATAGGAAVFDFESGMPTEFSGSGNIVSVGTLDGLNGFSGSMLQSSNDATASLSGLAAHDTVTLSFSLGLLDSWDGDRSFAAGPDWFNITADGTEIFKMTVIHSNNSAYETIPAEATNRTYGSIYGLSHWGDSLFDVTLSFAHTASDLELSFFADGSGWQGGNDEYWAIDNLSVTTSLTDTPSEVPLPAGLPLLMAGLAGLGLSRLRK